MRYEIIRSHYNYGSYTIASFESYEDAHRYLIMLQDKEYDSSWSYNIYDTQYYEIIDG